MKKGYRGWYGGCGPSCWSSRGGGHHHALKCVEFCVAVIFFLGEANIYAPKCCEYTTFHPPRGENFPGTITGSISLKSGTHPNFLAFGLSFRHACLCDGAPILSAMTTPTKMRNVSIYRLSRMWDGYGALRREAERLGNRVMCSVSVPAYLIS